MSNIAGKAYAMNVITPIRKWYWRWFNRIQFLIFQLPISKKFLSGLLTLSLIHYARWVIVKPTQFPHLGAEQPKETIKYSYMFFFSNFNGSWEQYVDSFHMAIPVGLNMLWFKNVRYPGSIPLQPFYNYITYNQVWSNHYYTAYPIATCNDVVSAKTIKTTLVKFNADNKASDSEVFFKNYQQLLRELQHDISVMEPSPIVSLSAESVAERNVYK